jgi:hypothetical protein
MFLSMHLLFAEACCSHRSLVSSVSTHIHIPATSTVFFVPEQWIQLISHGWAVYQFKSIFVLFYNLAIDHICDINSSSVV